ncbi:helix-turn-helix domain-containing protein [Spirosoma arcticum]
MPAQPITTHLIKSIPRRPVAFRLLNLRTYLDKHKTFTNHRHGFFELIFIETGSGIHTVDFVDYPIQNSTLFLISPGQVHTLQQGQIDSGFILIFDRDYVMQQPQDAELLMKIVACSLQRPQLLISESDRTLFRYGEAIMRDELAQTQPDYELVRSALKIMLIKALRVSQRQLSQGTSETARHKKLYFDFLWFIEETYDQRQEVAYYADKLMIPPKQLTELTGQLTGKTPLQLIHDRILTEAKRLLFYSELNVKEIAVRLGFSDTSYFSRFFTQRMGVSPKVFQKRNPKRTA